MLSRGAFPARKSSAFLPARSVSAWCRQHYRTIRATQTTTRSRWYPSSRFHGQRHPKRSFKRALFQYSVIALSPASAARTCEYCGVYGARRHRSTSAGACLHAVVMYSAPAALVRRQLRTLSAVLFSAMTTESEIETGNKWLGTFPTDAQSCRLKSFQQIRRCPSLIFGWHLLNVFRSYDVIQYQVQTASIK